VNTLDQDGTGLHSWNEQVSSLMSEGIY